MVQQDQGKRFECFDGGIGAAGNCIYRKMIWQQRAGLDKRNLSFVERVEHHAPVYCLSIVEDLKASKNFAPAWCIGPEPAVAVLREMIWAEANNLGIPISDTDVPFAITTADGGVDAVVKAPTSVHGLGVAPDTAAAMPAALSKCTASFWCSSVASVFSIEASTEPTPS